jgi:hypothetical protein
MLSQFCAVTTGSAQADAARFSVAGGRQSLTSSVGKAAIPSRRCWIAASPSWSPMCVTMTVDDPFTPEVEGDLTAPDAGFRAPENELAEPDFSQAAWGKAIE